jgi:superfamily I DNA and/or RNA helicase
VSQTPPSASIAVITTYAAQRRRLRALIGTPAWTVERQLQIDTVDAFEGRERDIVLVSLVRSNLEQQTGFVQIASRLNVALSRARRLLVIFGDTSTLRGPLFERLLEHVQALPGAMLPAVRLSDR